MSGFAMQDLREIKRRHQFDNKTDLISEMYPGNYVIFGKTQLPLEEQIMLTQKNKNKLRQLQRKIAEERVERVFIERYDSQLLEQRKLKSKPLVKPFSPSSIVARPTHGIQKHIPVTYKTSLDIIFGRIKVPDVLDSLSSQK